MKNTLLVIAVLLVGACATTPVQERRPRAVSQAQGGTVKSVAGIYEAKKDGVTLRVVFMENGIGEGYKNGKKQEGESKWKIVDGEIHVEDENVSITGVLRINRDGSITDIAGIIDGERKHVPKELRTTLKKIK